MLKFIQVMGPASIPLATLVATVLTLALVDAVRLIRLRAPGAGAAGLRRSIDAILFWGCLAAVLGFLGQWNGLFKAANAIFDARRVHPKAVVLGFAESLTPAVVGMFVLVAALALWFALRVALDRRESWRLGTAGGREWTETATASRPRNDSAETDTPGDRPVRWPRVVGGLGILVGVLMFLDQLGDLLRAPALRSAAEWRKLVAPDVAEFLARTMPSVAWEVVSSLVGLGLALLLLLGSDRLRCRRRSGAALNRIWAWLVVVWAAIETSRSLWWLGRYGAQLREIAPGDWPIYTAAGLLIALLVTLGYAAFLLVWLSRPAVRRELAAWVG